jgi:L-ascorbate metabolism protein UlaG (beta-lactamase superfamily)
MVGAQSGVPKYTRELLASVRERNRRPRIEPALSLGDFASRDLAALWIGHATVLLRVGGRTILTDPVFSERVGMTLGGVTFGVRRILPPAVDVEHLPAIDLVLLSHAHFDHLDRPSLSRLAQGPARNAAVVTAQNTRRLVPTGFASVTELPWGRAMDVGGVRLTALRPEHWGARTAVDRHRRFNAYLIESAARRVLFAGDTAETDAFDRVGPADISIFGIGAYDPWEEQHATPEQVWRMYTRMSGGTPEGKLLPMHHSTFALGREPLDEPMKRLLHASAGNFRRLIAYHPGLMWCHTDGRGGTHGGVFVGPNARSGAEALAAAEQAAQANVA